MTAGDVFNDNARMMSIACEFRKKAEEWAIAMHLPLKDPSHYILALLAWEGGTTVPGVRQMLLERGLTAVKAKNALSSFYSNARVYGEVVFVSYTPAGKKMYDIAEAILSEKSPSHKLTVLDLTLAALRSGSRAVKTVVRPSGMTPEQLADDIERQLTPKSGGSPAQVAKSARKPKDPTH